MGEKIVMVSKYYDEYSHKIKKDFQNLKKIYLLNCENFRKAAVNTQVFFDNGNITGVIEEIEHSKRLILVEIKNDGYIYESQ